VNLGQVYLQVLRDKPVPQHQTPHSFFSLPYTKLKLSIWQTQNLSSCRIRSVEK